jgi:hypothetical protein
LNGGCGAVGPGATGSPIGLSTILRQRAVDRVAVEVSKRSCPQPRRILIVDPIAIHLVVVCRIAQPVGNHPSADEQDFESGGLLRWVSNDMPVFRDPPPMRAWSALPPEAEALEWAKAVGVPAEAVLDWLAHASPRSKILAREDVGLLAFVRGD